MLALLSDDVMLEFAEVYLQRTSVIHNWVRLSLSTVKIMLGFNKKEPKRYQTMILTVKCAGGREITNIGNGCATTEVSIR